MGIYDLDIEWQPDRPVNEVVDKLAATEARIEGELTVAIARIVEQVHEDRQAVVEEYCNRYMGRCLASLATMRLGLKCLREYDSPDLDGEEGSEWQTC